MYIQIDVMFNKQFYNFFKCFVSYYKPRNGVNRNMYGFLVYFSILPTEGTKEETIIKIFKNEENNTFN